MKYLVMCEGTNEETIINLLLDHNKLKIQREDLIGFRPYNIRQLKNPVIKTELKHYGKSVIIYRIGDKQKDNLVIPKDLKQIVTKENIFKYCTKPELEILLIINEKLINDFQRSKLTPKNYAKEFIKYHGKNYDQSNEFLKEYYGNQNIENLCINLKEYKRIKKHEKEELYVADLLK